MKRKMKLSWKYLKNTYEIVIEYFLWEINDNKGCGMIFLPQITVLENL